MPRELSKCRQWEKDRRGRLNECFNKLSKLLPCYDPSTTISKVDILIKAAGYIEELQGKVKSALTSNAENKPECEEIKQLYTRIKDLLGRNEQLCGLLRDAHITIPTERVTAKISKLKKWSQKISPQKAEVLAKREAQKENKPAQVKSKPISKKLKAENASKAKPVIKTKTVLKKKIRVRKNKAGNVVVAKTNCVGTSVASNIQPCYFITNNTIVGNKSNNNNAVVNNTSVLSAPILSTTLKTQSQSFPTGTIILANNIPLVQSPTIINPILVKTPAPNTVILVNQPNTVIPSKNETVIKTDAALKSLQVIRPKRIVTNTTHVNKLPIPASRYATNYIIVPQNVPSSIASVVEKPVKKVKKKRKTLVAVEATRVVKKPKIDKDNDKPVSSNYSIDEICKTNKIQPGKSEEISQLSNDILESLQVPSGSQNPESTSPTAAFLNAFPLVSSFTGVKVNEVNEDEASDSQQGAPTLLQIGTMDATKVTNTENFTNSIINLENFSFLSHKEITGDTNNVFTNQDNLQEETVAPLIPKKIERKDVEKPGRILVEASVSKVPFEKIGAPSKVEGLQDTKINSECRVGTSKVAFTNNMQKINTDLNPAVNTSTNLVSVTNKAFDNSIRTYCSADTPRLTKTNSSVINAKVSTAHKEEPTRTTGTEKQSLVNNTSFLPNQFTPISLPSSLPGSYVINIKSSIANQTTMTGIDSTEQKSLVNTNKSSLQNQFTPISLPSSIPESYAINAKSSSANQVIVTRTNSSDGNHLVNTNKSSLHNQFTPICLPSSLPGNYAIGAKASIGNQIITGTSGANENPLVNTNKSVLHNQLTSISLPSSIPGSFVINAKSSIANIVSETSGTDANCLANTNQSPLNSEFIPISLPSSLPGSYITNIKPTIANQTIVIGTNRTEQNYSVITNKTSLHNQFTPISLPSALTGNFKPNAKSSIGNKIIVTGTTGINESSLANTNKSFLHNQFTSITLPSSLPGSHMINTKSTIANQAIVPEINSNQRNLINTNQPYLHNQFTPISLPSSLPGCYAPLTLVPSITNTLVTDKKSVAMEKTNTDPMKIVLEKPKSTVVTTAGNLPVVALHSSKIEVKTGLMQVEKPISFEPEILDKPVNVASITTLPNNSCQTITNIASSTSVITSSSKETIQNSGIGNKVNPATHKITENFSKTTKVSSGLPKLSTSLVNNYQVKESIDISTEISVDKSDILSENSSVVTNKTRDYTNPTYSSVNTESFHINKNSSSVPSSTKVSTYKPNIFDNNPCRVAVTTQTTPTINNQVNLLTSNQLINDSNKNIVGNNEKSGTFNESVPELTQVIPPPNNSCFTIISSEELCTSMASTSVTYTTLSTITSTPLIDNTASPKPDNKNPNSNFNKKSSSAINNFSSSYILNYTKPSTVSSIGCNYSTSYMTTSYLIPPNSTFDNTKNLLGNTRNLATSSSSLNNISDVTNLVVTTNNLLNPVVSTVTNTLPNYGSKLVGTTPKTVVTFNSSSFPTTITNNSVSSTYFSYNSSSTYKLPVMTTSIYTNLLNSSSSYNSSCDNNLYTIPNMSNNKFPTLTTSTVVSTNDYTSITSSNASIITNSNSYTIPNISDKYIPPTTSYVSIPSTLENPIIMSSAIITNANNKYYDYPGVTSSTSINTSIYNRNASNYPNEYARVTSSSSIISNSYAIPSISNKYLTPPVTNEYTSSTLTTTSNSNSYSIPSISNKYQPATTNYNSNSNIFISKTSSSVTNGNNSYTIPNITNKYQPSTSSYASLKYSSNTSATTSTTTNTQTFANITNNNVNIFCEKPFNKNDVTNVTSSNAVNINGNQNVFCSNDTPVKTFGKTSEPSNSYDSLKTTTHSTLPIGNNRYQSNNMFYSNITPTSQLNYNKAGNDKNSCSRYSNLNYQASEYNTFNPFTDLPKTTSCSYAGVKNYNQPVYTNNSNYNYQEFNTNYSTVKSLAKTDKTYYNYENYENPQYNYYNQERVNKNKPSEPRAPVNWMTTPDVKLHDFNLPPFKETDLIAANIYSQNFTSNTPTTYFTTPPTEFPNNSFSDVKKLEVPFSNYPREIEENQFNWSPTKVPVLDTSHNFVATTLPTLVGDLALNNNPSQFSEKSKNKPKDRRGYDTTTNFLSVSQLVDHTKTEGMGRISSRRNSGGRSKNNTKLKRNNSGNKSENKDDVTSSPTSKNQTKGYNVQNPEWLDSKRVKNPPSSYSAEALIGHQSQTTNVAKKQQNYTKAGIVPSFIPHDNLITYFPPVDLQDNGFNQQNQNYQNNSFNFPSSIQNNSYSSTFIPNPTTSYLPTTNFIPDITEYNTILSDNFYNNSKSTDNKTFKNPVKTPLKRDQVFPGGTPKKSKKSKGNTEASGATFVDFSFLSMPGTINSPILPDDFHSHSNFLPPPPNPINSTQLYPCKNPLYPKQGVGGDLSSSLLSLPPVSRAPIQHPEISPSINNAGTSLTNFNLSTIFPEINKTSEMFLEPAKNVEAVQRTQPPSNEVPAFSKSGINHENNPIIFK